MPSRPTETGAPGFADLFTPKLITVLREGYGTARLRADAVAGLTVAIVALPLSMALAIASGVSPEKGLIAAIVGGFLVSALGGSRYQIGGPAGAFIVLVSASVVRHGYDGFLLAVMLSGLILLLIGLLRIGTYIRYIPHPVTVGFTSGIGVIILVSQLRDLLGLSLTGAEPAAVLPKLQAFTAALPTLHAGTLAMSGACVATILLLRRFRPHWPGFLIVVVFASLVAPLTGFAVETIGDRFGELPRGLPAPALPTVTFDRIIAVLPDAIGFALLGGIESLLSAVVADSMTGRRHRSNCELVAQGFANIATALFGGICVTGTIARTATNVRAGASGPVSGMLHSIFLLLFLVVAAPAAAHIPLSALAAILVVVAWNMIERHAIWQVLRNSRGEAVVLMATLLLTIFRDLTEGIAVGVVLGSFLFMHRMASLVQVQAGSTLIVQDIGDAAERDGASRNAGTADDPGIFTLRISGPLFFGATSTVATVLERIGAAPTQVIVDLSQVPIADSTAALTLKGFVDKVARRGARVTIAAAAPGVRDVLAREGLVPPLVHYAESTSAAHPLIDAHEPGTRPAG